MKPFWKSKTIIVNTLLFVAYVVAWEPLAGLINPEILGIVAAGINMLLRSITSESVKLK